ncbi:MAG TPA: PepSY domain-containing protein [Vicinamibacteria bacterium]|nr:PepSY domain-containing protein [Vicinamibacteria bacterium]
MESRTGWIVAAVLAAGLSFSGEATADDAALRKEARISEARAREIALEKAPGTVKSSELEKEKGTLVWSFDIANATGGGITEVLVSAIDGHVVEAKAETAQQEAAEKAQEAKEKKAKAKSKTGSSTHH